MKSPQLAQAGAVFSNGARPIPLPDDVVHVCGFAGDDKVPAKSLLQWPRPMLYSGIAGLSR